MTDAPKDFVTFLMNSVDRLTKEAARCSASPADAIGALLASAAMLADLTEMDDDTLHKGLDLAIRAMRELKEVADDV